MGAPNLSDYQIDPNALNLKNALDTLLLTVENIYASYGVPLPAKRYWTIGDTAWDCEQLTISLMQLYLGTPGDEATLPIACNGPRSAVVNIQVVRCMTDSPNSRAATKAPTAEEIQDASAWGAVDSWTLMDALPQLDPWGVGQPGTMIATTTMIEPQGMFYATSMQLTFLVP